MPITHFAPKSNGTPRPLLRGRGPEGRIAAVALAGDRRPESQRIDAIAEDMDADYQVTLARETLFARIAQIPVTFSVENGDDRTEREKELIEQLWERTLPAMHDAFRRGRMAGEKVWAFDDTGFVNYIRKIDALPFSKTEMILEDDGSFGGIKLKPRDKDAIAIPPDKSWWLALDPTPLEPHGRSRYAGAPLKTWKTRKEATKLRDIFIRRFALGQGIYRGPATKENEDGTVFDNWDKAAQAYDSSRSGGLYTMASDWDEQAGAYAETFESLPELKETAPIDNTIDGMDAEQIRSFGFSEKTVTEGQSVGSFAMVAEQRSLLDAVALGVLGQYAESFQEFVADKIVEKNHGPLTMHATRIRISYPRLRETVDAFLVETVKGWLTSPQLSPLILSGAIDLGQVLHSVGIPVSDDLDAKIEAMIAEQRKLARRQPAGGPGFSPFLQQFSRPADSAADFAAIPEGGRRIPTQDDLVAASLAQLDGLHARLYRELQALHGGKGDDSEVTAIVAEIRALDADARVAAKVLGMLSPFEPELAAGLPGPAAEPVKDLSIPGVDNPAVGLPPGQKWRFPWVDDALEFLESKEIVTALEFRELAAADRSRVFSAPGVDDRDLLARLKRSVRESTAKGESLREFRQRIGDDFALDRAQTETLYRTNTHQAYIEGQEETLSKPHVEEQFPFVLYAATSDTRVRPEHDAMDGKVARRGSPLHQEMLRLLHEWNCRCTLIALSREDAEAHGFRE